MNNAALKKIIFNDHEQVKALMLKDSELAILHLLKKHDVLTSVILHREQGVRLENASQKLIRLHKKGFLTRYKADTCYLYQLHHDIR